MTTRKTYAPSKWTEQVFFNRLRAIVGDVNTQINDVKTGKTFSPEHDLNMNNLTINNLHVNEENELSAANVKYVNDKLNKLNDYRTISIFKSMDDVIAGGESETYVPMSTVVSDSSITEVSENHVSLKSSGLYKIELVTDLQGDFEDGFMELIVATTNEDGAITETVLKKHHLNETLVNSIVRSFEGVENLKLKVTNTNMNKEFIVRATLIVDKIYEQLQKLL